MNYLMMVKRERREADLIAVAALAVVLHRLAILPLLHHHLLHMNKREKYLEIKYQVQILLEAIKEAEVEVGKIIEIIVDIN